MLIESARLKVRKTYVDNAFINSRLADSMATGTVSPMDMRMVGGGKMMFW